MSIFDIGAKIREARKQKHITVAAMAELMGVTQPTITRWENGSIDMPTSALARYCDVLGITLGELFAEGELQLPVYLRQLLTSAEKLTPDQVEALNQFLKTMTQTSVVQEASNEYLLVEEDDDRFETLAAHRTDNPMDDLPQEALESIVAFKKAYRKEIEEERKKKEK